MTPAFHEPVLVREVLAYLVVSKSGGVYVDATCGGGGHTRAILESTSSTARVICIDRDSEALEHARRHLEVWQSNVVFINDVFSNIQQGLEELGVESVDGILFDLGISSYQIETPERGFAYQSRGGETPLDMRMDSRLPKTARDILESYSEKQLADIFFYFGEERKARSIARKIVNERQKRKIRSSADLTEIIRSVVGERYGIKSIARIFQALRIEVNAELDHLRGALGQTPEILRKGGRLVVISYHSLEDRIVKHFLKERSATRTPGDDPFARYDRVVAPEFRILTKKPVQPSPDEIQRNPRSRSAKLRAAERC